MGSRRQVQGTLGHLSWSTSSSLRTLQRGKQESDNSSFPILLLRVRLALQLWKTLWNGYKIDSDLDWTWIFISESESITGMVLLIHQNAAGELKHLSNNPWRHISRRFYRTWMKEIIGEKNKSFKSAWYLVKTIHYTGFYIKK